MIKKNSALKEKKGEEIQRMFSSIAPYYDFLNHFLSFHFDKVWRKNGVKNFSPKKEEIYLDLCCGTGDFGKELKMVEDVKIVGLDFSFEMLKLARKKDKEIFLINGDALLMPFKDETFDGCLVAFGIRNFENLEMGILEVARVLKKGGLFVILEFPHKVKGFFAPIFNFYFKFVLPVIGKIVSKNDYAYTYLPQSTQSFLEDEKLIEIFKKNNLELVRIKKRTFGIVNEIVLKK